jgi:MFS family permease
MEPRVRPTVILAVVSFGVFIAADDLTVASTMLRQIIGDLGIPLPEGWGEAAWIVNSYLVAYVSVMPFMGRLSDVLGRRRVYAGALGLFLVGSLWIPHTNSLGPFVAARVLTAIGGGAMVPVALAVIGDVYPERRRPRALGTLGAIDTIGWVWGPLFGALLVRYLSWRWQFYLNVPLAAVGLAATWWALRGLDRPRVPRRVAWPAAGALSAALVFLNIGLLSSGDISTAAELDELTGGSMSPLPFFAAAIVCFGLFGWLEVRARDPLIDLRLLRVRNVGGSLLVNFVVGAVLVIAMVDVPLFVNLVVETNLARAAVLSGWVLSALTAAMALAAWAGGVLTERTWYRPVIAVGTAVAVVAFAVMGSTWTVATSPAVMAIHLALLGGGLGLVFAPANAAAVDAVSDDRRGVAGGLVILARLLGLTVGLSGLTAWFLHRFDVLRRSVELPPLGDPAYGDALEAAQAELTTSALTETFLFAAVLAAVGVAAAWLLRRSAAAGELREP